MSDTREEPDDRCVEAAKLYAEGERLEAQREYRRALEYYEKSLRLHYDDAVGAARLRMLAAIGPK
ncbi:MAG: hypothetical protein ABIR47_00755 [Candidatus Kapaibacterium sp.]